MQRDRPPLERYGYLVAAACVVAATAAFYPGRAYFAKGQWALLYLLLVVAVAGVCGVRPALAAAALSFLAWNYFFIPPFHTLRVADPKDWLFLGVFLVVGMLMGWQTGRLRDREAEAQAREQETALLNRFSGHLVSDVSVAEVAKTLVAAAAGVAGASCVALFVPDESGEMQEAAATADADCQRAAETRALVSWVSRQAKAIGPARAPRDLRRGRGLARVRIPRRSWGRGRASGHLRPLADHDAAVRRALLRPRADGGAYSSRDIRVAIALANQAAVFLERRHLRSVAVQAEALREADRMKSTLVSAVSHELKTPLASLTATITGLLEGDLPWDETQARQELAAVAQDLSRLAGSIGSLLDLSRLEASEWRPHLERYELGEVLGTALSKLASGARARVSVFLPEGLPPVRVDFHQWVRVLEHLLGNALTYSGPDSPVRVGAKATPREVRMWVEDEGPGIPAEERGRVFDKFYRGKAASKAAGTGIGLAITHEIVRFHGGKIWLEEVQPHGARFLIALPRSAPDQGSEA